MARGEGFAQGELLFSPQCGIIRVVLSILGTTTSSRHLLDVGDIKRAERASRPRKR
jgi:hypothetical protein